MRKSHYRGLAVLFAAVLAAAIAVPLGFGSSHREAPNIALDPAADNTDVYAYTANDAPKALTIAADWIPGQVPANGPNFFRFDDRANYYVNIDNTGDGVADIRYQFRFKTDVRNPNSFLYAGPGTEDFDDPGLNVVQHYDLVKETLKRGKVKKETTVAEGLPVAPPNIGPKTFPDYQNFIRQSIRKLDNGTKVFVGSRDDPFFVDLGATFDAINVREGTGNEGQGASNAVVGVWSTTERRRLEVQNANADSGSPRKVRGKRNKFVQVSRLGNPLVNEVIIPLGKKD